MIDLELLSPARNADIGIEAIRHGADSVYIGAPHFGARAAAGNSVADIARVVDYAHRFGAKVYVTVNTLFHDDELDEVALLIHQLYSIRVDALIVQDFRLLTLNLPPIPLHASTQMDNQTPERVKQLYSLGFRQVVLARELSLDDIREIHRACPDMKLECFVHGALCVSLSGRCFASECLFGRSANRGECAQVCRMEFDLLQQSGSGDEDCVPIVRGKHLLSLKDLCLIHHLRELVEAGVSSFKIEGRLKDMAYVKNVTAAYSAALDNIIGQSRQYQRASQGKVSLKFSPDVNKSFNRGFTTYFLHGRDEQIASFDTPKSLGEPVGTVKEVYPTSFSVAGIHSFANGDGLCFVNRKGKLVGFRVNKVEGGRLFPFEMPHGLLPKTPLYRNFDKRFDDALKHDSAARHILVDIALSELPEGFRLTMSDDYLNEAHIDVVCPKELARTHQSGNIEHQLSKLGNTVYQMRRLDIQYSKNWFIPASMLSEWRRRLVEEFDMAREASRAARWQAALQQRELMDEAELPQNCRFDSAVPLMTCRHCLKHSMGWCRKPMPPLFLALDNGVRFRLDFDCKNCEMKLLKYK